jgi:nucleotidyltransferase substrate binding protein (TIGR01987 family)
MALTTEHLETCLATLEESLILLKAEPEETLRHAVFRNAVVKGFELALETSGKLLRKALKTFDASPRSVDALSYKEALRAATKHALLAPDEVERWFTYRDNRNDTAHDYGEAFARQTLMILPAFLTDAKALAATLRRHFETTHGA